MQVLAEADVKKDARNRVTLPASEFEHYHVMSFEDGHIELYPRILTDPLISMRTLETMDTAMANFSRGMIGPAVKPDTILNALRED